MQPPCLSEAKAVPKSWVPPAPGVTALHSLLRVAGRSGGPRPMPPPPYVWITEELRPADTCRLLTAKLAPRTGTLRHPFHQAGEDVSDKAFLDLTCALVATGCGLF